MEILVCIKQVPADMEVRIDPQTGTLIRDGIECIVNPFDRLALELAVRHKERHGGSVTVLSMGPRQTEAALRECLAVGADEACLASDRTFGGADTLATSYVFAQAARIIMQRKNIGGFDLILCGKQAIDSDTAQVGAELAEALDLPQVTGAVEFEQAEDGYLVLRERKSAIDQIKVKGPCVLTIGNAQVSPRYPTMKSKMASMRARVLILGPGDMDALEPERTGSAGSPTKVTEVCVIPHEKDAVMLDGSIEEIAGSMADILQGMVCGSEERQV